LLSHVREVQVRLGISGRATSARLIDHLVAHTVGAIEGVGLSGTTPWE
jgi:hypothetical protein